MKNIKMSPSTQAFSLMEMLIVIAIIGVMGAMIFSAFGPSRKAAEDECYRRNAQQIASTAAMASAAGALFIIPNDATATIQNLVQGKSPSSGVFKGRVFKLPPMEDYQIQGALKYLALHNTELVYNHE
jgi:prepilin-type N-terminal cleavage/methylation domain-containing protein